MDIKTISLPLPSDEYDHTDQQVTRRITEQAIETISSRLNSIEKLDSNQLSNAIRKKQFLLMGATEQASKLTTTAEIADGAVTSAKLDTNITVSGTLDSTGKLTADAGIDVDNFNIDGTTIALSSGNMTVDVAGSIILNADGGQISFQDDAVEVAVLENSSSDFKIESKVQDKDIIFAGNDGGSGIEAMRIDMSEGGAVGIGTTSPLSGRKLDVRDVDGVTSFGVGNNAAYIQRGQTSNTAPPTLIFDGSNGSLASPTDVGDNKEIGRILFRGYHTNGFYTGASITAKVQAATGTNDMPSQIRFSTSPDGSSTPVQVCVMYGEGQMHFKYFNSDSVRIYPQTDDAYDLGLSSYRFDDIFATNGTIQTSDSREKTTLTALTTNEINASKALAKEFGTYKWLSAVSEKGSNARTHIGITAQKVKEIMEANSLDPTKYAFYCYDEWEAKAEEKDEETEQVIKPALKAGNRYGIRYSELHSFIVAGFNARLTALEDA